MKKENFFKLAIISLASIILLIVIYKGISASLKLNQGKYRVSDVVVSSTADVVSRTEENGYLSFDASQANEISMIITAVDKAKVKSMSIKNIEISGSNGIYISQKDREEVEAKNITNLPIDISYREDGSILLELEVVNKNVVQNQKLPEKISELKYDGRVFADIGKKIKDIAFTISYTVEIVDNDETINNMKVELTLPDEHLITQGYYVERMKVADFVFKTN